MSLRDKFIDGVNTLFEKISTDEHPLSEVDPAVLERELEGRKGVRASRTPRDNPVAQLLVPGAVARKRRSALAAQREKRIRGDREREARAAREAQEDAFRRMADEARRQGTGRPGASGARRRSHGPSRGFAGLGEDAQMAKHYKTLDLPYGADFAEVKAAFRKLMRKYHPDLHNQSPQKLKAATELSMQVTQAYNALEEHLNKS